MTKVVYWIWLQLVFGIGTRRCELFMNHFEHPREVVEGIAARNHVLGMLEPGELDAAQPALEQAETILRRTEKKGCRVATPEHPEYPALLHGLYDRPAALYYKGDLGCLRDALSIAMVGTRKHTEYGKQVAVQLAGELAAHGAVVVSGLAAGIDSECHRAALAAGGKTVGILGCGIDVDYPKPSRELKTAMSRQGAVVTEYPLGAPPLPEHFPLRNRLIAGMCKGTVVVEADRNSGSLITARLAREQGRDVFAVPGSVFGRCAQGTHQLLREGARLAERGEDIWREYAEYPLMHGASPEPVIMADAPMPVKTKAQASPVAAVESSTAGLPAHTGEMARQVYGVFSSDTLTVDDIATALAGAKTGDIQSALTELEIYGVIQSFPGRRFGLLSRVNGGN